MPELYEEVVVPEGVVREVTAGLALGVSLPDLGSLPWIKIRPVINPAVLPLAAGLGIGEREVLALALELEEPLVVLDDSLARRFARRLNLSLTGTLGLLLKAKQSGRIDHVRLCVERLEELGFRIDPSTRENVLKLAEED